jgi:hypothetical protein
LIAHLDAILGNDQLDALFLNVFISCASTCFLLTGTADSHSPECVIPDDVLIQFGPPDDEHLLLETCRGIRNKCINKECIKLVITQNREKTEYTPYIHINNLYVASHKIARFLYVGSGPDFEDPMAVTALNSAMFWDMTL